MTQMLFYIVVAIVGLLLLVKSLPVPARWAKIGEIMFFVGLFMVCLYFVGGGKLPSITLR